MGVLVGNHSYAHLLVAERYQLAVVLVFLLHADRVDGEGDRAVVERQKLAVVLVFLLYADLVDGEGDRAVVERQKLAVVLVFLLYADLVDGEGYDALEDFGDDCRVAHRISEVEDSAVPLLED